MRSIHKLAVLLLLATTSVSTGCSDSLSPEEQAIQEAVGDYVADNSGGIFRIENTAGNIVQDLLAAGSRLRLKLNADGTTEGQMFIPGSSENGDDFDANMAGRWSIAGTTIRFTQLADTFVKDTPFEKDGDTLASHSNLSDGLTLVTRLVR